MNMSSGQIPAALLSSIVAAGHAHQQNQLQQLQLQQSRDRDRNRDGHNNRDSHHNNREGHNNRDHRYLEDGGQGGGGHDGHRRGVNLGHGGPIGERAHNIGHSGRVRERLEREREKERMREEEMLLRSQLVGQVQQTQILQQGGDESETDDEFVQRKKYEVSALPKGWYREEIVRRGGLSAGKVDVSYTSPDGRKFRTKPQLVRLLGDSVDLSNFDFRTGKMNNLLLRKNKRQRSQFDYSSSRGVKTDASLLPPIRQTASIFKQPVTVFKTQESRVKADFKHGLQDKPKQLFWEKRLEGLRACDRSGEELVGLDLPQGVLAVGPRITPDTVLQSVATALHVTTQPIVGQTGSKVYLETNPGVFLNPEQPLIHAVAVNEDDIRVQEDRVVGARKKLEEALMAFFNGGA